MVSLRNRRSKFHAITVLKRNGPFWPQMLKMSYHSQFSVPTCATSTRCSHCVVLLMLAVLAPHMLSAVFGANSNLRFRFLGPIVRIQGSLSLTAVVRQTLTLSLEPQWNVLLETARKSLATHSFAEKQVAKVWCNINRDKTELYTCLLLY